MYIPIDYPLNRINSIFPVTSKKVVYFLKTLFQTQKLQYGVYYKNFSIHYKTNRIYNKIILQLNYQTK